MTVATKKDPKKAISVPGFYTCEQAAERLKMKADTVRRYVHREIIPAGILGDVYLISKQALETFAKTRRNPGRPPMQKTA